MENRDKVIKNLNDVLDELPVVLNEEQMKKKDEIKELLGKINDLRK